MTREGRLCRTPEGIVTTRATNYEELFASLFSTGFKITNLDYSDGLTDFYIIGVLMRYGKIAHYKPLNLWLTYEEQGELNVYGLPSKDVRLYGANGYNVPAQIKDCDFFYANPRRAPIIDIIKDRCSLLADFDAAIDQNLDAVKEMSLIITQSDFLANKMKRLDAQRRKGASVGILNRPANDISELTVLKTEAEYKIDRLRMDRRGIYEDLLHIVGIQTPNEKYERLITPEVHAQSQEVDAYVGNMLITFNQMAEIQGAPQRLLRTRESGEEITKTPENNNKETDDNDTTEI